MRTETPFVLVRELIGVDALIAGPSGNARVTLIVDTGAARTTVVPRVAEAIGYSPELRMVWSVTRTAVGEEHGYMVRAVVEALGLRVRPHPIVVADLGYDIDGLLGIDFLRHFEIGISFAKGSIVAEKLAP
jgi:predicted aspartyl protease